jgi:CelD/BcsL family acetyltransferase involved in cellulose biosynthesis
VNIQLYTEPSVFDHLHAEWNDLVTRSAADTVFSMWEWQSTWWKAYQPGDLHVVTCRTDDGRLVGIGSWFIHIVEDERVLRSIGCVDVTDYVDLIVDQACLEPVMNELASCLREHRASFDRINLCNIPETSPTRDMFAAKLKAHGFTPQIEVQEVCPIIALPPDWEAFLNALDKKERHEIRRKLRRAEGEAEIEYVQVDERHDRPAMYQQFIELMRASHPQKAAFLQDSQHAAFFNAILPLMDAHGWLRLSFLNIDGTPSAAYCDFDYKGRILVYNSGLLPEKNAHLSPGIVLLSYNIRYAIESGHHTFDFLRGNEAYKYRMGGKDTCVYMLRAR